MPDCNAAHCRCAPNCGRHKPQSDMAVDYSHGQWFEPDACFGYQPEASPAPSLVIRLASL